MADRTPRIAPFAYNLALAAATVITASSYETSLPASFVRDPVPTKRWRSKLGWNHTTGVFDQITFTENGVARTATIVVGNYATGALEAAAWTTAFNAAAGVVNTYAWTYSATTKLFTLTRTAGTATVGLPFLTGASAVAGRSAHADLGFSSTDKTGSLSYAAEAAAYHSREYLLFDFGSAMDFPLAIVLGYNLGSTGTVTLKAKASADVWSVPAFTQILSGDALATLRLATFGTQLYRYALLQFDDTGNTDGFTELGIPFIGTYWEPSRGFQPGDGRKGVPISTPMRADEGALSIVSRKAPKQHAVQYVGLSRTDRDTYQAIEDAHGHVFLLKDPQSYPASETVYGLITQPAQITSYGPLGDRFTFGVVVDENLG